MLPDILHGGVGNVIAGDGDGLRGREDICIAGRHFLQGICSDFDVLEVRLAVGAGGSGDIHGVPFVTGSIETEGKA